MIQEFNMLKQIFFAVALGSAAVLSGADIILDLTAGKAPVVKGCRRVKTTRFQEVPNGFFFDGKDANINYGTPKINGSFAFAVQVNMAEFPKKRAAIALRRGYHHILACDSKGQIILEIWGENKKERLIVKSQTRLVPGKPCLIVAVFDASNNREGLKLYVNGVLEGEALLMCHVFKYGNEIIFGADNPYGKSIEPMKGTLNFIRVWNGLPSDKEMKAWAENAAKNTRQMVSADGSVSVADFGAVSGDGKDDTDSVRRAFKFAVDNKAKKLIFPKGIYNFAESRSNLWHPDHWLFWMRNVNDLEIDGQGSTFIFSGTQNLCNTENCRNVTFKNFTVNYTEPFYTSGKVVAMTGDKRQFDVKFDPYLFKIKGGEPIPSWNEVTQDMLNINGGMFVNYRVAQTRLIAPDTLRIFASDSMRELKTGMILMLRHYTYSGSIFRMHHSVGHKLENITIHSGKGMGIVGQYLDGLELRNIRMCPAENSPFPLSVSSDAINLLGCYGKILIENCYVKGSKDDSINVFSNIYGFRKITGKNSIIMGTPRFHSGEVPQDKVGDKLIFMRPDFTRYAVRTIKTIKTVYAKRQVEITFTEDLPKEINPAKDIIMTLKQPESVIIRNNKFHSEGRICIQTSNVLVENCEMINSNGFQLNVCIQPWYEGIPSANVIVRNNRFVNSSPNGSRNLPAAIIVSAEGAVDGVRDGLHQGGLIPFPVHSNVEISGNRLEGGFNSAMVVSSVKNLVVKNNTFSNFCTDTRIRPWRIPKRTWNRNVINIVDGVENAVFENNSYSGKNGGNIAVSKDLPENAVKFNNNKGFKIERKDMRP